MNWKSLLVFVTLSASGSTVLAQNSAPQPNEGHSQTHRGPVVPNGKVFQEILDKLDLSPEQKDSIKALRKSHRDSIKLLRTSAEQARAELDQSLEKNQDQESLKAAFEKHLQTKEAVDRERFKQMLAIREVLTDKQRALFASLRPKGKGLSLEPEVSGD